MRAYMVGWRKRVKERKSTPDQANAAH
jgi:hypothetical protein